VTAAEIAAALGGGQREGRNYRARCPLHGGNSLCLADGGDGKLLLHCFGGCDGRDVFVELRARGLIDGDTRRDPRHEEERSQREDEAAKADVEKIARQIRWARALYQRGRPAAGNPVETYLRTRRIRGPIPPVLRFLQDCPHRNGNYLVNVPGEQIGIHKTFLKPDGFDKADLPRAEQRETCGVFKGGAIRLAPHLPGAELLIGEGVETVLAAMQLFGLPGWSAICAGGIEALELPPEIRAVVIAADNDENSVGQRAALTVRKRWVAEGRSVRILLPPKPGDFNDVLLQE
jgi:hypothetical protein